MKSFDVIIAGLGGMGSATARKLVEVVYGMMKTQTEYREPIGPSPLLGSNRTPAAMPV